MNSKQLNTEEQLPSTSTGHISYADAVKANKSPLRNTFWRKYRLEDEAKVMTKAIEVFLKGELKSKNRVCFCYFLYKHWTYETKFC